MTVRWRGWLVLTLFLPLAVTTGFARAESPPGSAVSECAPDGTGLSCVDATPSGPFPFAADPDPGIPSGVVALMVVVALIGVGITIWRVATARDLARRAGMDPDQATAITLLGNDGLDAAYVASTVRRTLVDEPRPTSGRSAEERLTELRRLKDRGLVTEQEYEARRTAILESL